MPTDSAEQRALAVKQRDQGLIHPGLADYDAKMSELWGGPPPKFYPEALAALAADAESNKGRVALVTGSSGGIGFYVAKALAAAGFTVIIPSRPGLAEEAEGAKANITAAYPDASLSIPEVPLDLNRFDSVRAFAACICAEHKAVDVLALNAGRGGGAHDAREQTGDGHEAIMQVNALSHALLTHDLLPVLCATASDASRRGCRIISQSSGARFGATQKIGKVDDIDGTDASSFNAFEQYCLSKAANVLFTKCINERLVAHRMRGLVACVCDPGLTSTGVNIQHDLTRSIGMSDKSTNALHDERGHHAADGALPMIRGCVAPDVWPNDWYTTNGVAATSLHEAGLLQTPYKIGAFAGGRTDPLLEDVWSRDRRESFWRQCTAAIQVDWEATLMALNDAAAAAM